MYISRMKKGEVMLLSVSVNDNVTFFLPPGRKNKTKDVMFWVSSFLKQEMILKKNRHISLETLHLFLSVSNSYGILVGAVICPLWCMSMYFKFIPHLTKDEYQNFTSFVLSFLLKGTENFNLLFSIVFNGYSVLVLSVTGGWRRVQANLPTLKEST